MNSLHYRLSQKVDAKGYQELLLIVRTHDVKSFGKSRITIHKDFFHKDRGVDELMLNRRKTHYAQRDGVAALAKLDKLKEYVSDYIKGMTITKDTLKDAITSYYDELASATHKRERVKIPLPNLFDRYIKAKKFQWNMAKGFYTLLRAILRFEAFTKATVNQGYEFNIDTITRDDIENLRTYLEKEDEYAREYPTLFAKLLKENYVSTINSRNVAFGRGENTCIKMICSLKAFLYWCIEQNITSNNPFEGYKIGMQHYGTPSYITIEERNIIASVDLPTEHLRTQRDIFIFHCLVGCRVSDLMTLTKNNIILEDGQSILQYVPIKTKNEKEDENSVRVPLLPMAMEYVEKYKGVDAKGRLLPFITAQKYNEAIKVIFRYAGVTRPVPVRNSRTGATEYKPICDVASSHMARRTFVGNLYFKVQDPTLIGAMSGHTEGSKAFQRYRRVETPILSKVINLLEE